MEPIALGDLALLPWEFGALTPWEFTVRVSGHRRRQEDTWLQAATVARWLLAPHVKGELTPAQLLGWPSDWVHRRAQERTREQRGPRSADAGTDADATVHPRQSVRRARSRER